MINEHRSNFSHSRAYLFVILLGYLAGHFKKFDKQTSKGLNTLVTKFALPAHLFVGVTTTPRKTLIDEWPF